MKHFVLPLFTGILFLIFQTTLLTLIPIQQVRPDILLIFTLYLTFLIPPATGGILAMSMGYFLDLFSGNALGFYTFSRPLLFFAAYFFKERFYLEGFLSQFLFAFAFGMSEGFLILFLLNALQPISLGSLYPMLLMFLLPQSFITGAVAPVLFPLFQKVSSPLFFQAEKGMTERG